MRLSPLKSSKITHSIPRRAFFVDVVVDGRVAGNAIAEVAAAVRGSLTSGSDTRGPKPCAITIHKLSAAEMPTTLGQRNIRQDEITAFVEKRFNQMNPTVLVYNRPGFGSLILGLRSTRPDEVAKYIYEQLKRGSGQFSGSRPSLLCAHFLDMTPAQLLSLHSAQERGEPSALNLIATRLFRGNRPFLYGVQYSVPGSLLEARTTTPTILRRHFRENGPSYAFANHQHPVASDPRYQFLL
jgi:hypothetical protein